MKIAIPVDEKSMGTNVCVSFGRTPYFLIYDTESKESSFINNSVFCKNTRQIGEINCHIALTKRISESSFGEPARHGHLPALKAVTHSAARP